MYKQEIRLGEVLTMDENKMISINAIISQKTGFDETNMDGEVVMMDINEGKYYCLNDVGSRIWELIKKPIAVKDVMSVILSEYDVDAKVCEDEVYGFLIRIYNDELISIV